MRTTYTERIRRDSADFPYLEEAAHQLEEVLGGSAALAETQWDLQRDERGKPLYTLTNSQGPHRVGQRSVRAGRITFVSPDAVSALPPLGGLTPSGESTASREALQRGALTCRR